MSYPSLLYGTKKFLLETLTWNGYPLTEARCNVMIDGRPPQTCGDMFIAIHPGGFRGVSPEIIEAVHQLNITLTFRVANIPKDKAGVYAYLEKNLGIGELAQKIVEYLHNNYIILKYANEFIENPKVNRWVEPLRLGVATPPRIVGGDWVHAPASKEEVIIQSISFGEAKRVQFGTYQPYPEMLEPYLLPQFLKDIKDCES